MGEYDDLDKEDSAAVWRLVGRGTAFRELCGGLSRGAGQDGSGLA